MRLSPICSASFAMLVLALALGCGRDDKIQTYTVPKEPEAKPEAPGDPAKAGSYRLLGAIIPIDDKYSWFIKFSGPADRIDPYEKEFDGVLNSLKPNANERIGFDFATPPGGRLGPPKQMRVSTIVFGSDDKTSELYLSGPFGGTLLDNVNRWRGEVGAASVDDAGLKAVVEEKQIGTVKLYRVDFKGPGGKGGMRGPMQGR